MVWQTNFQRLARTLAPPLKNHEAAVRQTPCRIRTCFGFRNSAFGFTSVLLPLLAYGPNQLGDFGHFKANFFLDDLRQRDISGAHVARLHQRAAHGSSARIELADAPRDQVDQNVGVANLLQCFSCKFGVQGFFHGIRTERGKITTGPSKAIEKSTTFTIPRNWGFRPRVARNELPWV